MTFAPDRLSHQLPAMTGLAHNLLYRRSAFREGQDNRIGLFAAKYPSVLQALGRSAQFGVDCCSPRLRCGSPRAAAQAPGEPSGRSLPVRQGARRSRRRATRRAPDQMNLAQIGKITAWRGYAGRGHAPSTPMGCRREGSLNGRPEPGSNCRHGACRAMLRDAIVALRQHARDVAADSFLVEFEDGRAAKLASQSSFDEVRAEASPRGLGNGGPARLRPVNRHGVGCGAPPLYADAPMWGGERTVFAALVVSSCSAIASVTATSEPSRISGPLRRKRSPAASS